MTYKVIVTGSRRFFDYRLLEEQLTQFLDGKPNEVEIITRGELGTDYLAKRFAKEKNIEYSTIPIEWAKHGKSAGYRNNTKTVKYANACVIFTEKERNYKVLEQLINLAKNKGLELNVIHL